MYTSSADKARYKEVMIVWLKALSALVAEAGARKTNQDSLCLLSR